MKYLQFLLLLTLSCTTPDTHFVAGTDGIFVFVSGGGGHACALDREGKIWCWGAGLNGQLGNGVLGHSNKAIPMSGDRLYKSVCANGAHSCAIDITGAAWCWGENWEGQLGLSSPDQRTIPTQVETTERFTRISCGSDSTCALGESGDVWCWGFAGVGPQGQAIHTQLPVKVEQLPEIGAITLATHRFGTLTTQGVALEYAADSLCDIANHNDKSRLKSSVDFPWENFTLSKYCGGNNMSCGLTQAGKLFCRGRLSGFCEICSESPRQITDATYTDLSCGEDSVCVIDSSGAAKCFGNNHLENLAVGSTLMCLEYPRPVLGSHRFTQVSTNREYHCALEPEGSVWCWSNSVFDADGNTSGIYNTVPTRVELDPAYVAQKK